MDELTVLRLLYSIARHYREPLLVGLGYVAAYAKSAHIDPAMAGVITLAIGGLTAWVKGWKPERLQRTPAAPHCPDKVERPPEITKCNQGQSQFHAPLKDTHDSRNYQNFTNGETWNPQPPPGVNVVLGEWKKLSDAPKDDPIFIGVAPAYIPIRYEVSFHTGTTTTNVAGLSATTAAYSWSIIDGDKGDNSDPPAAAPTPKAPKDKPPTLGTYTGEDLKRAHKEISGKRGRKKRK